MDVRAGGCTELARDSALRLIEEAAELGAFEGPMSGSNSGLRYKSSLFNLGYSNCCV